jgi:hypothetical protein
VARWLNRALQEKAFVPNRPDWHNARTGANWLEFWSFGSQASAVLLSCGDGFARGGTGRTMSSPQWILAALELEMSEYASFWPCELRPRTKHNGVGKVRKAPPASRVESGVSRDCIPAAIS